MQMIQADDKQKGLSHAECAPVKPNEPNTIYPSFFSKQAHPLSSSLNTVIQPVRKCLANSSGSNTLTNSPISSSVSNDQIISYLTDLSNCASSKTVSNGNSSANNAHKPVHMSHCSYDENENNNIECESDYDGEVSHDNNNNIHLMLEDSSDQQNEVSLKMGAKNGYKHFKKHHHHNHNHNHHRYQHVQHHAHHTNHSQRLANASSLNLSSSSSLARQPVAAACKQQQQQQQHQAAVLDNAENVSYSSGSGSGSGSSSNAIINSIKNDYMLKYIYDGDFARLNFKNADQSLRLEVKKIF